MPIKKRDTALTNAIHNAVTPQIGLSLNCFVDWSSGIIYQRVI